MQIDSGNSFDPVLVEAAPKQASMIFCAILVTTTMSISISILLFSLNLFGYLYMFYTHS